MKNKFRDGSLMSIGMLPEYISPNGKVTLGSVPTLKSERTRQNAPLSRESCTYSFATEDYSRLWVFLGSHAGMCLVESLEQQRCARLRSKLKHKPRKQD